MHLLLKGGILPLTGCFTESTDIRVGLSRGRSDTKPRFVSFRSRKGGILPPTGRTQW